MRLIVVLMLASLAVGACSSARPTRFRAGEVRVGERTADGLVLNFLLSVDNPGEDALPFRAVEYAVTLGGKEVFRGTRSAEMTLRRFGTQEFVLPAAIPASVLASALASTGIGSGTVPFTIRGEITYIKPGVLARTLFDAEVVQPSVSFAASGEAVIP